MGLGWLLVLLTALPRGATGAKRCIFCDFTESATCPGVPMTCGDDEDCFTGQGVLPGLGRVTNKGCMLAVSCGRRDEPVLYQGATYNMVSTCCSGDLCNGINGKKVNTQEKEMKDRNRTIPERRIITDL
ncbi:PREDICTED: sperm acrosome membrane-associated protein 4-like [Miniopterus natalensis]|uniref:sperm acrosome membrane-associated protein 4-like n=1 Tax=Miniopterus natalensis TaxID=291302 RepID=UPI0007A70A77|nr:PREDICTED: sperm acrosome membrane-associated protein 4-like [Miniopterus natalensis]